MSSENIQISNNTIITNWTSGSFIVALYQLRGLYSRTLCLSCLFCDVISPVERKEMQLLLDTQLAAVIAMLLAK